MASPDTFTTHSERDTYALGETFAATLRPGTFVLLHGDLSPEQGKQVGDRVLVPVPAVHGLHPRGEVDAVGRSPASDHGWSSGRTKGR